MIPNYGENIYLILTKIVKLNFKAQIKDSGIELKNIYHMTDLESKVEYYLLITNGESIVFKGQSDFIKNFILYLESNLTDFDNQFEDLQKRANEFVTDENAIFIEHEYIGSCGYKQSKLLEKIRKFEKKNVG